MSSLVQNKDILETANKTVNSKQWQHVFSHFDSCILCRVLWKRGIWQIVVS